MTRAILMALGVLCVALPAANARADRPGGGAAKCTHAQKAANAAALATYQKRMPSDRAAFFRKHRGTRARATFLKRQQSKLRMLRAAARCTAPEKPALPPAAPPNVTYVFGATVGAADRAKVEEMMARIYPYMVRDWDTPAAMQFALVWDPDLDVLAREFAARTGSSLAFAREALANRPGVAGPSAFFINADLVPILTGWWIHRVLAHELYHVVQQEHAGEHARSCPDEQDCVSGLGPRWLSEGSAEVVGWTVAEDAGFMPSTVDTASEQSGRDMGVLVSLGTLERLAEYRSIPWAGPVSHQAVRFLVGKTGPASLAAFYKQLGTGAPWEAAFAAAFGRTPAQFYAEFDAHRRG